MPLRCHLALNAADQQELRQVRDHAPRPYLRERAAILLAIAAGASIRQAATHAGLKPHDADTVCVWVRRYRDEGSAGLRIRPGRGRKPAAFRRWAERHGGG